jgi:RND family efflux transporter MFP subunit
MRRWVRSILFLVLAGLVGLGWYAWQARPLAVQVVAAARGPAVEAVYATGTVEPVRWAAVGPAVKARLREVLVDDGDRVTAGQLLAHLDDTVAAVLVAEAEARAAYALTEAQRLERLAARANASRSEVERSASEARALEAVAEATRRKLDDYELRAPIDGVVLRRDGEPGEMVDTADTVFWIGDRKPLRITADVDEEDVPRVRPGQKVLLRADAYPDRVLEGELTGITPKGDPVQKTYRVRIALPDEAPLLIGMTVEANIVVRETDDALLVPTGALRDGHLFVMAGDRAERRAVDVGVQGPGLAEIRAKLAAGEMVIVDPPASLESGRRVRVDQGGLQSAVTPAVAAPDR